MDQNAFRESTAAEQQHYGGRHAELTVDMTYSGVASVRTRPPNYTKIGYI